jgi:hypothetical protein
VCFKNIIFSTELWVDNYFEIIAVEGQGMDPKCMWEVFTEICYTSKLKDYSQSTKTQIFYACKHFFGRSLT